MDVCRFLEKYSALYDSKIALYDICHQITYSDLYHEVMDARENIHLLGISEKCIARLNVQKDIVSLILFLALLADNISVIPAIDLESLSYHYDYVLGVEADNENHRGFWCFNTYISVRKFNKKQKGLDFPTDTGMYINSTSGSSGSKKFCISNWNKIMVNTKAICQEYCVTSKDVLISLFPAHVHIHESFMRGLYSGGTSVLVDSQDINSIANFILLKKITQIQGTPSQMLTLSKKLTADMAASVEIVECVGGTLSSSVEDILKKIFINAKIVRAWGSAETTGVCISTIQTSCNTPNAIGKCISGYECRLEKLQNAEHFQLMISGEAVIDSLCDSIGIRKITEWLDTGDLVEYGSNNNLLFCGRRSGMIKYAGENIYPEEIETMLCMLPEIIDAIVVGLYDEFRGEYPAALVQKASDLEVSADQIKKSILMKGLELNKLPKKIHVTDKALPYKEEGKKDRRAVIKILEGLL